MAQTPEERRRRRDEYARSKIDPRTGKPFRNYNALDTYQRNLKAKQRGFTSRAQERYQKTLSKRAKEATEKFPESFKKFLGGNKPTDALARDFLKSFGPYPHKVTEKYKTESEYLRAKYIEHMSLYDYDWDWSLWREEYSAL